MRKLIILISILITLGSCSSRPENNISIPNIIFETDLGNDVDDVLAMDMLYKYLDAGQINLLAISINKEGVAPIELAEIMNYYYGYSIPISTVGEGADCESDAVNYAEKVANMKDSQGDNLFKRKEEQYNNYPNSVALYRRILSQMPDNSVTIISVGFSTNLSRLLDSAPDSYSDLSGRDLIAKKVKLLCTMGGSFINKDFYEYNIVKDIPSAKNVFENWPTELVTSPFEVGININYPGSSIENDFKWSDRNPLVEAYKSYLPMPYDRPTWDLTSVLYGVEGIKDSLFTLSPKGRVEITEKGETIFTEDSLANRYYLKTDQKQNTKIRDYFISTITRKPKNIK